VEEEQLQLGDPQKTSENEAEGASVSKNKSRRKRRTGIPKNLPFSSCPVSFDPSGCHNESCVRGR